MANHAKGKVQKNLRPGRSVLSRTLFLMTVCGVLAFAVLIGRLYYLMVVKHDYYESRAVNQQTREVTVRASRGTITDRNGNRLAVSATAYNVFLSPNELAEKKMNLNVVAEGLASILGTDAGSILEKTGNTESMYEVVARLVDADTAEEIREFISRQELSGIYLEESSKRYYPYGDLCSSVVGFVGTDGYGLMGLETKYDDYLSGTDGSVVRLTNAAGTDMLFTNYEYYYDAVDGCTVKTTLDVTAEHIVENILDQAIADYAVKKGGCAIVMDVNTGAILCMATRDSFDPNDAWTLNANAQSKLDAMLNPQLVSSDGKPEERAQEILNMTEEERQALYDEEYGKALYEQWKNRTVSDTYEPGSVFKPIVLSMALEDGIVNKNSTFECLGSMPVLGRGNDNPLHCWNHSGHGVQELAVAVQNSCNVAFANIGLSVGADRFYDYIEAFGLFRETGVDLPGEGGSVWWSEDIFYDETNKSQLASASFGQTFNITPLQMITAYCSTINGGYLMKPHIVESITDAEGNRVYEADTEPVRQVISGKTSETVRGILESVVSDGTGGNAAVAGYRIGGKTGTSEKVAQDAAGGDKEYMVSFCGFAPADDPEIAVLVILDTPSDETGIYISGGNMGAPTVGKIFSELLPYLGYDPEYTEEEMRRLDVRVPTLTELSVAEAEEKARGLGLNVYVNGEGEKVTGQLPAANSEITAGSTVILYAGKEASRTENEVPDLYGMTVEEARLSLEWVDMFMDTSGTSPVIDGVVVSGQSVPPGTRVPVGTVIETILTDQSNLGLY